MTDPDASLLSRFWRFIGTPFRAIISLTSRQVKSLFSIAMLGGIIVMSWQNVALSFAAARAVDKGDTFRIFFDLIQEQMRFNSALIAWFAFILGLIVFGADFMRAKWGDKELGFGKGDERP